MIVLTEKKDSNVEEDSRVIDIVQRHLSNLADNILFELVCKFEICV
jgi:hypothetical protein